MFFTISIILKLSLPTSAITHHTVYMTFFILAENSLIKKKKKFFYIGTLHFARELFVYFCHELTWYMKTLF